MRKILFLMLAAGLIFCSAGYAGDRFHFDHDYHGHIWDTDDFEIDVDDGVIIIEDHGRRTNTLEITPEYELYLNGELIKTNEEQKKLVEDFYVLFFETIEYGKEIGYEGAKIGLKGAKLGLKAVGRVFKMIFTGYEAEDLERDMEREAELLEEEAEELEEMAEEIEDMVEELEDIAYELQREIPELRELDWF